MCILLVLKGGSRMVTKVWQRIKKGEFAPVYLIVGEESYFIDETLAVLKKTLNKNEETEMMMFDLEEQPLDYVMDEADTIPFFSERKLIIAKNASFLKASEKGKEKIDHDLKRFEKWIAHPSDTAITVFVAPYEKLDERKKVTKLLKERAEIIEAKTLDTQDLNTWIDLEVQGYGKIIAPDAIEKLVEMVGPNMLQLRMEIEKMALYLGENYEITTEIVEQIVAKTLEHDAFKMLKAYLENRQDEALEIYHDLLRQKEEPIALVGLLASNIRLMSNVYYLDRKGYSQQQIASRLKVHPYRVKLMLTQQNRPSDHRLLQALYSLANVDLQLKSVSGNRERLFELFLMKPL